MKSYTRSSRFLFAGYTFQQEIEWKQRREELRILQNGDEKK